MISLGYSCSSVFLIVLFGGMVGNEGPHGHYSRIPLVTPFSGDGKLWKTDRPKNSEVTGDTGVYRGMIVE